MSKQSNALAKLRRAASASQDAGARRDELIVAAAHEHSYSEVAEAAGLSKARVAQIVSAARPEREAR